MKCFFRYPLYTPTKAEAAAIRKGRATYKRGESVTLDQLHKELDAARRQPGKKSLASFPDKY